MESAGGQMMRMYRGREWQYRQLFKTEQQFTYADPCMEYGPTLAYNEKAATRRERQLRISSLRPPNP